MLVGIVRVHRGRGSVVLVELPWCKPQVPGTLVAKHREWRGLRRPGLRIPQKIPQKRTDPAQTNSYPAPVASL
jgi:hypothetical protein